MRTVIPRLDMVGVVGSSPIAPTKFGRRIKHLAEAPGAFFLPVGQMGSSQQPDRQARSAAHMTRSPKEGAVPDDCRSGSSDLIRESTRSALGEANVANVGSDGRRTPASDPVGQTGRAADRMSAFLAAELRTREAAPYTGTCSFNEYSAAMLRQRLDGGRYAVPIAWRR